MKKLKIVIPKGRLNKRVVRLLNDAGVGMEVDDRCYIPKVDSPDIEAKIMKPQNIPQLVEVGCHDIGFTGYDWMVETSAKVLEIMDLGFDPVSLVAVIFSYSEATTIRRELNSFSEILFGIAAHFLMEQGYDYYFIRTYGATEVFPPQDADMIVDNMASGRTLAEHQLKVIQRLLVSTTRMIVNPQAWADANKRARIEELKMLMQAVLDAENRVMLEMNIPAKHLDQILTQLPCMRAPTVAPLYANDGYAAKIAIKKREAATLIPKLKAMGASDILEYDIRKVLI